MNMNKYGIVVILYKPDLDVLTRIKKYSEVFDNILLTDNTEEPNLDLINKLKKITKVTYHWMGENAGMSKALNFAFQWSIEQELNILLTMDQDTYYSTNNIKKMVEYIENDNCQAAIYSANYSKLYLKGNKKIKGRLNISLFETKEVMFSMTSGSFMNVKYLSKILPLDDWFIGFVDYDVCASIKTNYSDAKFIRVGNSIMYQEVGQLVKDSLLNKVFHVVNLSETRYYYMLRNICFFKRKYKSNRVYYSIAKQQEIRILINLLFEKNRFKKIKKVIQGYRDAKRNKY